jgi:hypothetical protein
VVLTYLKTITTKIQNFTEYIYNTYVNKKKRFVIQYEIADGLCPTAFDKSYVCIDAIFYYLQDKLDYDGITHIKYTNTDYKHGTYYDECKLTTLSIKPYNYFTYIYKLERGERVKIEFYYTENVSAELFKKYLSITVNKNISTEIVTEFLDKCYKEYLDNVLKPVDSKELKYFIKSDKYYSYTFESDRTFDKLYLPAEKRVEITSLLDDLMLKKIKKVGFLFYGIPGGGKTTIIKCIANYTKRHIISININNIKNQKDLMDIFFSHKIGNEDIPTNKRIFVLEDIDCDSDVAHQRHQKHAETEVNKNNKIIEKLTLSGLLNGIDGILELHDSIIIMTTNHIDALDNALIRPGRINLCMEFGYMKKDTMIEMIKDNYNGKSLGDEYLKDGLYTPARLENMILMSKSVEELGKRIVAEAE